MTGLPCPPAVGVRKTIRLSGGSAKTTRSRGSDNTYAQSCRLLGDVGRWSTYGDRVMTDSTEKPAAVGGRNPFEIFGEPDTKNRFDRVGCAARRSLQPEEERVACANVLKLFGRQGRL